MDAPALVQRSPEAEIISLATRFLDVRRFSESLAGPLSPEDCTVQSMPDVSPTKWHLAHTTWFFETFVLEPLPAYKVFNPQFRVLFNSYYNGVGEQFSRPHRGLLSRPSLSEVLEYRRHVDAAMRTLLEESGQLAAETREIVEIGLHHEQQHQELLLTDIKHVLAQNPLHPAYRSSQLAGSSSDAGRTESVGNRPAAVTADWSAYDEGLFLVGDDGSGFAYDNERPRHRVFVEPFALATRPVTCGEWLQFMEDGGYTQPRHWLSLGWTTASQEGWSAPMYWFLQDGQWWQFTLSGACPVDAGQPVCHVSYFEADAFARWAGYRLPTEAEWETAAVGRPVTGHFADTLLARDEPLHPVSLGGQSVPSGGPARTFGDIWEWTASPYTPYPGYRAPEGALGEYNGKFMCNQYVLRGGSCATHSTHIRPTYRNFFPPEARWQFSGLRLARDA